CRARNTYIPPPPPEVTVAHPEVGRVIVYSTFTGTTKASNSVQIRARVTGYLDSIHFEDGAEIDEGKLLVVIDPRPFNAKLAAAKAVLMGKKAVGDKAARLFKRIDEVRETGGASAEEWDKAKGDLELAKADVEQAQANLRTAKLNLDYTVVR